ncbi:MAG: TRAP transporter substrate-binding protein [Desulfuromonadales bacterium]
MKKLVNGKIVALALITAVIAVCAGWTARADASQFVYKYANNLPATHPMNIRAKEMADNIKKESGGRIEIQVFPNNQLGSDTDMLSQIRSGAIQFFTLSPGILSTLVPNAFVNGVGFAFKDYDTVWAAMDGDLGKYVRNEIAKTGTLFAFDKIWDNGFRQITCSTRPIKTPEDLKGLKIRVPVSPLWTSMFKSLNAAPASINFSEVYSALQTKTVEAQENPIVLASTNRFYEVQKYVSLTNHMWDGFWFLGNKKAWDKLPKDLQDIVTKNINAAAVKQRADVRLLNDTVRKDLQAKGMVFNDVDSAKFQDTLRKSGFYAEWHKKFGEEAWSTLEKYTGRLK